MLDLANRDIKATVINIFEELKEALFKILTKYMMTTSNIKV